MCTIPLKIRAHVCYLLFHFCVFSEEPVLPSSSCLLFELCSLLLGHCRCLLEGSIPGLHFLPKHLQLLQTVGAEVDLIITNKQR